MNPMEINGTGAMEINGFPSERRGVAVQAQQGGWLESAKALSRLMLGPPRDP